MNDSIIKDKNGQTSKQLLWGLILIVIGIALFVVSITVGFSIGIFISIACAIIGFILRIHFSRQEAEKDLQNQLADAKRQLKLNETEKQYMSAGMDSETAQKMAQAVLDGDVATQGDIMKSYAEVVAKKAKADALKSQKDVDVGDTDKANKSKYTKENFKKGLISME